MQSLSCFVPCADQLWKQANQVVDWARARQDLAEAEAKYEQAKKARPDKDWRTTASGGPQMRKAINHMKQAVAQKDVGMLDMALGELRSELGS